MAIGWFRSRFSGHVHGHVVCAEVRTLISGAPGYRIEESATDRGFMAAFTGDDVEGELRRFCRGICDILSAEGSSSACIMAGDPDAEEGNVLHPVGAIATADGFSTLGVHEITAQWAFLLQGRPAHDIVRDAIDGRTTGTGRIDPEARRLLRRAQEGTFPDDFDAWDAIVRWDGATVSHIAAAAGTLPDSFERWAIPNDDGWTVAHEAARAGTLPPGFDKWRLATSKHWTVAHEAATHGHLPKEFAEWDLADRDGCTVAHVAARKGNLPKNLPPETLALEDASGKSVAIVAMEESKDWSGGFFLQCLTVVDPPRGRAVLHEQKADEYADWDH
ncbi:MAG: ankyrin repeat domain-containing protein [Desulfovibrio sp.]|jgi:hypothetical protein|nr:ankyrin repeat domain-containing protein [Desulfovibrio sp.]